MLRSKASGWAAAPYLVWMVLFIVVPLGIVVWYALTNSDGQVTLANLTSIGRYASVFGRSLLLAAEATIICLVLAVICLAVGAAGGSAPKYLISAVLLLALGAVNFHGALKGGAEQELLRWTDERDRLVAMRSCQITLQEMSGLLFGGAMTALRCYASTRRALFQTVGITLCAVILTLFFVTMAANRYFERRM